MAWKYDGRTRPPFAESPGPGRESVWDYPRPPVIKPDNRRILVRSHELAVAESTRAVKVLETASAPTFYLPPDDVNTELLKATRGGSFCEWKGSAVYFDLDAPWGAVPGVAWSYPSPSSEFSSLAGLIAFYPAKLECFIDEERVRPQAGGFYGGWVTSDITGPVKGDPGTEGW